MVKFSSVFILLFGCVFSEMGQAQETNLIIERVLNESKSFSPNLQWQITSEHISSISNIHHIYFEQLVEGIPIQGTESSIHLSSLGTILTENNRFVKDISEIITPIEPQLITPINAVRSLVAQMGYKTTSPFSLVSGNKKAYNTIFVSDGGVSQRKIPLKLVYTLNDQGAYIQAWKVSILELDFEHW